MRVALASLALLTSLTACAFQPVPDSGPSRYQPLRASIVGPRVEGLSFHVNRPSYVALFEIVPGGGTSLVYPGPGMGRMNGFVFSGAHDVTRLRRYNADQYLPVANRAFGGPRFFFLIASERPLDLGQFGGYGMGLRSSMGMHFASANAYRAMESVASMVLPSTADDGSWTSDMYVHWPNVLYDSRSRGAGLVPLSCNGYTMYVPLQHLLAAREAICTASAPRPGADQPQPGDSASSVEPRRRAPLLPKRQAEELRERISSSTQLEGPRARRPQEGARSGAEADRVERARVAPRGDRGRSQAAPSREPRSATPRSATPRKADGARAEPRSRPAATPSRGTTAREPVSRPATRSGDAPRAGSGRPSCDPPCQQN